jgi:hypothetical protein
MHESSILKSTPTGRLKLKKESPNLARDAMIAKLIDSDARNDEIAAHSKGSMRVSLLLRKLPSLRLDPLNDPRGLIQDRACKS